MMEAEKRIIGGWTLRVLAPRVDVPGLKTVVVMLHGWTGDEKVMWIFAPRLPKRALIIAPRGLYKISAGGYGWHNHELGMWPTVEALIPPAEALFHLLTPDNFPNAQLDAIHLIGFSQGAALSLAFGLLYPNKVASMAVLSGFMPEQAQSYIHSRPFEGKPIFVAHGTKDELVPVEKARTAVTTLQHAGADVVYCEDEVGHKLSLSCFSSLEHFFAYAA
jgi:phospholipase/carboxylesterase